MISKRKKEKIIVHLPVVFSAGSAWIRRGHKRLELSFRRRQADLGRASFYDRHSWLGLGRLKVVLDDWAHPDWRALIGPVKTSGSFFFFANKESI